MAKALLGHVGAPYDARMAAELRRLQRRVKELEAELEQLRGSQLHTVSDELLTLSEPALT
jgi:ABC-type phosphate transport system auxiliary subunit